MNRVKTVFIGCGGIAHAHAQRLRNRDDVTIVGCCDASPAQAEAFSAAFGAPVFENYAQLFEKTKPHAAYIATPPFAHGPCEIEAAERGIHFFVEKPVALDMDTARQVAAAVRKAKLITAVGYCFRYSEPVLIAQQLLKGRPVSIVTGNYHCGMPGVSWWRRRGQSGGQIVEQTTHIIDLLLYLCGPASEVHAMAAHGCMSQVSEFDIDDSSVLTLRLKTGAVASITSSCVLQCPGRVQLEIVTPERILAFDGAALRVSEANKTTEHRSGADMYTAENAAFIKAVQQGKRTGIRCTYADAVKTLRVTLAANESICTGMPVKL